MAEEEAAFASGFRLLSRSAVCSSVWKARSAGVRRRVDVAGQGRRHGGGRRRSGQVHLVEAPADEVGDPRQGLVGVGAVVRPAINIGANVIVGAGAAVVSDVSDALTVTGVPARVALPMESRA